MSVQSQMKHKTNPSVLSAKHANINLEHSSSSVSQINTGEDFAQLRIARRRLSMKIKSVIHKLFNKSKPEINYRIDESEIVLIPVNFTFTEKEQLVRAIRNKLIYITALLNEGYSESKVSIVEDKTYALKFAKATKVELMNEYEELEKLEMSIQ